MTGGKEYGRALFMLAEENKSTETVYSDLVSLSDALKEVPEYVRILDNPSIPRGEKLAMLDEATPSLSPEVRDFAKFLAERRLVSVIDDSLTEFSLLRDEKLGIERVYAVSAVELTEKQLDSLKNKLESQLGKTVIIKNAVDKSILGGIKLRYAGIQLDGSVKTRLDKLEKILSELVV